MLKTDIQTLKDLGINDRADVIPSLFNRALTQGGENILNDFLRYPMNDAVKINQRSGIIRHFADNRTVFPFEKDLFDAAEHYLSDRDERTRLAYREQSLGQKLSGMLISDTGYKTIVKGIQSLLEILNALAIFLDTSAIAENKPYSTERELIKFHLSTSAFSSFVLEREVKNLSREKLVVYDTLLRFSSYDDLCKLLQYIYQLDAYLAIGQVAVERGFCFAIATAYSDAPQSVLCLKNVRHPAIAGAKGNDVTIDNGHNVVFLTGANMAGKSTFMKSLGIAVYLAHTGLPIAATRMEFTVMDGLLSTINLPDNLGSGVSHFYAEVLRMKMVAQELHAGKRLFVLFDELFRGTNVKDAGEATIEVVDAFTSRPDSFFIISTHIIEAGEALQSRTGKIQYRYLPTKMDGLKPIYTYQLEQGITEDRHGMVIIRNEGILNILTTNEN